jgi:hypothetical protein
MFHVSWCSASKAPSSLVSCMKKMIDMDLFESEEGDNGIREDQKLLGSIVHDFTAQWGKENRTRTRRKKGDLCSILKQHHRNTCYFLTILLDCWVHYVIFILSLPSSVHSIRKMSSQRTKNRG